MNTDNQYDNSVAVCKDIFLKKAKDYGTSWRVLRKISIVDQIYIKAQRIRNIQENEIQKIDDDVKSEFLGIVNYGVIGLIQLDFNNVSVEDIAVDEVAKLYEGKIAVAKQLMQDKNHDYGEAWREMSQESFADLILVKVLRMKQILSNNEKTLISEGIDANFLDIINYALFALILINEGKHTP